MTTFAQTAALRIVEEDHVGELIYAGGGDVLAFLPTETVIACARRLRGEFGKELPGATLSGGIAVVHHKEDLRFALGRVRAAEKAAKRIGRTKDTKPAGKDIDTGDTSMKDALALTVCKRSGGHGTVVMADHRRQRAQGHPPRRLPGSNSRAASRTTWTR